MIKFAKLFSFSKKEVDGAFDLVKIAKRGPGLKILQSDTQEELSYGKLLIVVPRKSGKAHKRNLFRRRIKSIFYTQKLYQKPVISILFGYEQALSLTFDELKDFLMSCFP